MRRRIHVYQETAELDVRYALCHMRRRIHVYQETAVGGELDVRYATITRPPLTHDGQLCVCVCVCVCDCVCNVDDAPLKRPPLTN